jgi:hypothetical protein
MYEQVLQLPIFQGLSRDQLTELLEKVPFQFDKYHGGDVVAEVGRDYTDALFLVAGEVVCQTAFVGDARQPRSTSVICLQHFQAPHTLSISHLFGMETTHPDLIRATGEVGMMSLSKTNFLSALQLNRILLVNTLNNLSSYAQRSRRMLGDFMQLDEAARLGYWLVTHTHRSAYDIKLTAAPDTWARMLMTDVRGYWKAVTILEKNKVVESQGDELILTDRYALRKYVDEKLSPI